LVVVPDSEIYHGKGVSLGIRWGLYNSVQLPSYFLKQMRGSLPIPGLACQQSISSVMIRALNAATRVARLTEKYCLGMTLFLTRLVVPMRAACANQTNVVPTLVIGLAQSATHVDLY